MRSSITDIFIKHPVLAVVVNLVIVLAGLSTMRSTKSMGYEGSCGSGGAVTPDAAHCVSKSV